VKAFSTPITYDLSFGSGAPDGLTGSITTDGTIGNIFSNNITGWSFASVGTVAFSFSSTDDEMFLCTGSNGCFSSTASSLSFDFSSTQDGDPRAEFSAEIPGNFRLVAFINSCCVEAEPLILVVGEPSTRPVAYAPGASEVIGTARATVPEPSSIALLGIALAAGVAVAGKRSRARQISPV
jgi:PEP-CTERM motif